MQLLGLRIKINIVFFRKLNFKLFHENLDKLILAVEGCNNFKFVETY